MFKSDVINQVFDRITIIGIDEDRSKLTHRLYCICKCKCGTIKSIRYDTLQSGAVKSCGCLNLENITKSNRIEFDSNLGCLRVYFNNCDEYFLCDIEDRDIAEKYCWRKGTKDNVVGYDRENKVNGVLFYRLVMEKLYGNITNFQVDHWNHNRLDNRRYNLRLCTNGDNSRNRPPMSNTGEKYITYNKNRKEFIVLMKNELPKYFKTFSDAKEYRDNYINKHYDKFYYDPSFDVRNRDNQNVIYPFIFINPYNIIHPFTLVGGDKE